MSINRVLIIGGGLSGICLVHQFLAKGIKPTLIDSGENHSSRIAAGMINPMVFRAMVKTWKGDELIPYLKKFYPQMESEIETQFFYPRKIRRLFSTDEERQKWLLRQEDNDYQDYIFKISESEPSPNYAKDQFESGWVKSPGYIDANRFLEGNYHYLKTKGVLLQEEFQFENLNVDHSTYNGNPYDVLIFAEGYRGKSNPYFGYLPLQQTKGEVLTLETNELKTDEILNRKCFVLPTEDGYLRLGATFSWNTDDVTPTEEAREELINQYKAISTAKINIIDQQVGIRPTVTDRRPLIGPHPEINNLFIFNGMGTKGYMIAPYFSAHLIAHLLDGTSLDPEVNINRFEKKFFKKEI
jgi:glycine/D-amino acid oxidase-like deaminating enzyme